MRYAKPCEPFYDVPCPDVPFVGVDIGSVATGPLPEQCHCTASGCASLEHCLYGPCEVPPLGLDQGLGGDDLSTCHVDKQSPLPRSMPPSPPLIISKRQRRLVRLIMIDGVGRWQMGKTTSRDEKRISSLLSIAVRPGDGPFNSERHFIDVLNAVSAEKDACRRLRNLEFFECCR